MTKLNEVFSKDSGITISDINKIETGILHENHEIEITDIDNYIADRSKPATKKERKNQNRKIVSELISFLNSGRGVGLLFLGLAEINGKIDKKGVKSIKTKEQIRSIIYSNIGSIPSNIKNFKLDVIPVEYKDGNIFIIEVENNDLDCVFYSKMDNLSYERRGDECKSISLPDFLELLAKKNHSRIFTKFEETLPRDDSYVFNIIYINEGIEPGMYISTQFLITSIDDVPFSFEGSDIHKYEDSLVELKNNKLIENGKIIEEDLKELNIALPSNTMAINCKKYKKSNYNGRLGYPPNTIPVYPGLQVSKGQLIIEKRDFQMLIIINNYEKRGKSYQEFFFSANNDKIEILEVKRTFKPYLTL